jgi:hypothetical protein
VAWVWHTAQQGHRIVILSEAKNLSWLGAKEQRAREILRFAQNDDGAEAQNANREIGVPRLDPKIAASHFFELIPLN